MKDVNLCVFMKLAWRLAAYPQSDWALLMRPKYFSSTSLLNARVHSLPSHSWHGIVSCLGTFSDNSCWSVVNGDKNDLFLGQMG